MPIIFPRAVLARWRRPAPAPAEGEVAELVRWLRSRAGIPASPDFPAVAAMLTRAADLLEQRHPAPVPVAERLPGPEDCDAEGNIWAWRRFDPEGDMDNGDFWCLAFCEWLEDEDCGYTHWLSYPSLPLPDQK